MTNTADDVVAPRRWWIAVPLTLFTFGVGYLYVGRPLRALAFAIAAAVLLAVLWTGAWGLLAKPFVAFVVVGVTLAAAAWCLVDVVRIARRSGDYALRPYNRWWIYLALIVAGLLVRNFDLILPVRQGFAAHNFSVPARSMVPTLRVGDYFIADMRAYEREDPQIGAVVVLHGTSDPSITFVKRVAALPGDRVQCRGGVLFVNGEEVKRDHIDQVVEEGIEYQRYRETLANGASYYVLDRGPDGIADDTGVFEVPAGNYFVLGDNRDNSNDSRIPLEAGGLGYIPRANFMGRASWIDWSSDLSRIGTSLE